MTTTRPRPSREREQPRATPSWARLTVLVIATAGIALAGYLAYTKWAGGPVLLCRTGGACDLVQSSRYALFLGVPTALWGALLYAAVAVLAALGLSVARWRAAYLLAAGGAAFSLYLTYLSAVEIRGFCPWCLASVGLMLALVTVLVVARPSAPGKRSPTRPARLAWQAAAAAVATIVAGAAVFAGDPFAGDAGYAAQLARHLTACGAVFYGAFW
jgi:uncharacterized membrane protein